MKSIINKQSTEETYAPEDKSEYMLDIEAESLHLLKVSDENKNEMNEYYPRLLDKDVPKDEVWGKLESLKRATVNITKALTQTYAVSDEFGARWNDIRKQNNSLLKAPANAEIDFSESRSQHFARGLNIYKLLLICFIGSFAGVVIELLWCFITHGYVESRSGLVYGPFNLLYGVGAVALTVCLYRLRNHGSWLSFLGGMVVGSAVEYACSWGQEMLFGSRSWDYSAFPFNLNGRICLLYSVFWGALGVMWIKNLYPRMAKLILKIPNLSGKIITWVLAVFFVFNTYVSGIAMLRWSQRVKGIEPSSVFFELIDKQFPNERMEKIYANMKFSKQK